MTIFLFCLFIVVSGGIASCFAPNDKVRGICGAAGIVTGSFWGIIIAGGVLFTGVPLEFKSAWALPMGSLTVALDSLSAFFLCAILGLSLLSALYGLGYQPPSGLNPGDRYSWFWLSLLVVSMALVVIARDAIVFLLAWELMSLSSFFLVAYENNRQEVRRAAWMYLVATHLGSAFLLAMFVLMGAKAGSFDYESFGALGSGNAAFINLLFVLALIGFGTKAGFYPLHVWLPEAHPAAPSHVSALMSGVMIKTGIYALIRFVAIWGHPPAWWGWLIIAVGAASGILGVIFALAQHDLKRLLAYHSVENIGIIALGFGLGILGWSYDQPFVMLAGFAGALLHVLNHAVFKGLLFLAAGSVLHATGCRNMEKMGGLLKRLPLTGAAFLTGSAAISGLPPLNGFVSEFLIYAAALASILRAEPGLVLPGIVVVGSLALIGGLASACFAKAFGIVFLGEPRSPEIAGAHECGWAMRIPMLALSAACFGIALLAPFIMPVLLSIGHSISGLPLETGPGNLEFLEAAIKWISVGSALLLLGIFLLAAFRRILLRKRVVGRTVTWDCGYARPTVRMQYTASSFAQPILNMFRYVVNIGARARPPTGYFPKEASFETHAEDTAYKNLFAPLFRCVDRTFALLRWIQEGRVQVYVLYIAITLLVLLIVAL